MSRTRAFRLAPDVRPEHVELHLEVDPERGDRFRGSVRIDLRLSRPRRTLELHAAEIRVSKARLRAGELRLRGRLEARPQRETVAVRLPRVAPAGPATLELHFSGRLRRDLRGLYAARAEGRRYALTQLAATHARRVFPCFDEPAMKARFRVSVTTGAGHQVIANEPRRRLERHDDGRVTHHFATTPPLPSYLVALAVGAFEASPQVRVGATPIRVWSMPGRRGLTRFAREAARESLSRLERWFGLPHPYRKLDLVAVPDFEFGAMENAGAVFFRETALLLDPATASLAERKRVAEVVAHELSHMWFGNLVTMAWWDDLWLNESFATWMAFQVVDDWQPGWRIWRDFQRRRAMALEVDALRDTHPIYVEVRHPDEATENFDLITYEKGAGVVRMLERALGPAAFRRGVRGYIRSHREGNAVGADLWRALGRASGRDVAPVVRCWIERAGHPLLQLRRSPDGRSLVLRQERFRASGRRPGRGEPGWLVPFVGRVGVAGGRTRRLRADLSGGGARLPLPRGARFVYGNADQGALLRVEHDAAERARLVAGRRALTAVERMGWLDDQWALARAGRAPLASFLELLPAFVDDSDPQVIATLAGPLLALADGLAPAAGVEPAWRDLLRRSFGPLVGEDGFAGRRGEDDDARTLRALRLRLAGAGGDAEVVREAGRASERLLRDPRSLDPDLADVAVELAARAGGTARFDAFERAWRRAATPQQARRFLLSLPRFPEPRLQDRALALALDPAVAGGDVAFLLCAALEAPAGRERAWRFVTRRWRRLSARMGAMLVTRVVAATPQLGTRDHRQEVARFFREHPVPTGARAVRQALERFDLELAFRRRAAPELRRWLAEGERSGGAAQP